jgi:hypothetical protein
MWSHDERPFREVDKIRVAAEFIFAAERLIARDVRPELLPDSDRATVEYYLECLSKKFSRSSADISRAVQSALRMDDDYDSARL